jgi:hypothetical protein
MREQAALDLSGQIELPLLPLAVHFQGTVQFGDPMQQDVHVSVHV